MDATFKVLALLDIRPSPSNPRKTFDPIKLDELAKSIASKGMIEPLVVRPLTFDVDGIPERFELVVGERRWRAAGMADFEEVPCLIRELNDVEVLELQTIENLQRDDLNALEEADGYAELILRAGYDVEQIAGKIGRSKKYVYDRIKLRELIPELRQVLINEEMSASHAILLSRLGKDDQLKALEGEPRWGQVDGLFQHEAVDPDQLELDDHGKRDPRKAVSVRELDHWINDHVRFRPEDVDLPNLFPETELALRAAAELELKVVSITREYRVNDDARAEERTYGVDYWKRADGEADVERHGKVRISKVCDHSVLGVVVAGHGRGEAFPVCVNRKKCTVHWSAEIAEAKRRAKNGKAAPKVDHAKGQRDWKAEERVRQAEQARWKKAQSTLLETLAETIISTPAIELIDVILKEVRGYDGVPKQLTRGQTLEDAVHFLAFVAASKAIRNTWNAAQEVPKALKPFGIDAKKIVNEVAPAPKKKAAAKPKAKKKPKRKAKKRADAVTPAAEA